MIKLLSNHLQLKVTHLINYLSPVSATTLLFTLMLILVVRKV